MDRWSHTAAARERNERLCGELTAAVVGSKCDLTVPLMLPDIGFINDSSHRNRPFLSVLTLHDNDVNGFYTFEWSVLRECFDEDPFLISLKRSWSFLFDDFFTFRFASLNSRWSVHCPRWGTSNLIVRQDWVKWLEAARLNSPQAQMGSMFTSHSLCLLLVNWPDDALKQNIQSNLRPPQLRC